MQKLRLALINLAVFSGIIASIEVTLNVAQHVKHGIARLSPVNSEEVQTGRHIPRPSHQVFHPGVGHSNQKSQFAENANTSKLIHDNISATEVFGGQDRLNSEFNILVLGGSTTDPLGTQYSGYRGTWVHHLFEVISKSTTSRYTVENAGNGGSTSSNELLRLITKLHTNDYDLIISFNGINELYFADFPQYKDGENILASRMLLTEMWRKDGTGIIKGVDGNTYSASFWASSLRESKISSQLGQMRSRIKKTLKSLLLDSTHLRTLVEFKGLSKED